MCATFGHCVIYSLSFSPEAVRPGRGCLMVMKFEGHSNPSPPQKKKEKENTTKKSYFKESAKHTQRLNMLWVALQSVAPKIPLHEYFKLNKLYSLE